MNRLCCSLSQILRRCRAPAARQRLLHWCSSASRVMMPAVRRAPSTVLGRQYRWYDDPRKALTATAIGLSAAVMAARQVVPGTNRSHLVALSAQKERDIGESRFAELKHIYRHRTVDPCHPDSVRVRLIADRIIHAANRGLGIYDTRDAPLLRVTRKEKKKKPWARQPHTRHLHGLDACWELVLVSDGRPRSVSSPGVRILLSTGMLDWFKTDGEIAFTIAHEVGHHIARHTADIMNILWLPKFLRLAIIRRAEIEADRIGILLLAAAGFHPDHALEFTKKAATDLPHYSVLKHMLESTHPRPKDRLARLSEAKTMEEALELYREATARDKVTGKYFSNPTM